MALSFFVFIVYLSTLSLDYNWQWSYIFEYSDAIVKGFLYTLTLSLFSLILTLIIGLSVALFKMSSILILKYLANIYVEIIRSTPILVQFLVFYYIIFSSLNLNNPIILGVIMMSIFSGAYTSEIIRAGIESIENAQIESATSLGLTRFQIYIYVIYPQVIVRILPSLTGQIASLIKDSSILSFIAIEEFTFVIKNITARTALTFEGYILLAIGYFLITYPISLISRYLEYYFRLRR